MPIDIDGGTPGMVRPIISFGNASNSRSHTTLVLIKRLLSGGTSSVSTVLDANIQHNVGAVYATDYLLQTDFVEGAALNVQLIGSAATLAGNILSYVSDGEVRLVVSVDGQESERFTLQMRAVASSDFDSFVGWHSGAAAVAFRAEAESLLITPIGPMTKQVYSTKDHTNAVYVRNTESWVYPRRLGLTCASPWNSAGGDTRAGTAITKRHVVMAQHFSLGPEARIRFITQDNVVVERTILAAANVESSAPPWNNTVAATDIQVCQLDSDLPETIVPAKVLAWSQDRSYALDLGALTTPSLQKYLSGMTVPVIALDQEERASLYEMSTASPNVFVRSIGNVYSEEIIGGDSGNPVFLVHPSEAAMILVTTWTTGGFGGGGPSHGYYRLAIQTTIDALCTAASLNPASYQIGIASFS